MTIDRSKVALFDLDNTLADYHGGLRQSFAQITDEPLPTTKRWPSKMFTLARIIKNQPGWWANLPVIPTGLELFEYCQKLGYQNFVLTQASSVAANSWTEKFHWIEKNLKPISKNVGIITTVNGKGLVYGRLLVDDHVPYMKSWLEHRHRAIGIMPRYDSNAHFSHPQVHFYKNNEPLPQSVLDAVKDAYNRKVVSSQQTD